MVNSPTDNRNSIHISTNLNIYKECNPPGKGSHLKHHSCLYDNTSDFRIFHQNIRGLRNKTCELSSALYPDWPHVICLTEHHLNSLEFENCNIDHYKRGIMYCRKTLEWVELGFLSTIPLTIPVLTWANCMSNEILNYVQ